ncbi:DUF5106 domain-containing protein [Sphingobacterium spiritivorum]|uniref:DUF5106 domain-containing protein n=1 Tax=Sphingobacterium spiritivorum TaxID=258 RepID=UPI001919A5E3|nr:DUF5106 domain-containing protein [Sphingobacterium spiritivorum]QQT25891.1 DUF5106 domain-containing protein [Sphingobacterium spiritivorum]
MKNKEGEGDMGTDENSPATSSAVSGKSFIAGSSISQFWDNFDFHNEPMYKKNGEQAMADFIGLFPSSSDADIENSVFKMLSKAQSNPKAFLFFQELYRKYLYDPNSPLRSDLYYEPVLKYLISSDQVSATDKSTYKQLLKTVQKNKEGTPASPFSVTLQSGKVVKLRDIESPYLLVMFYEPDCNSCKATIAKMKEIPELNTLIDHKKLLKVLAVYAVGNEEIWKDYFSEMPANWLNGIDKNQHILTHNLYDLKAAPTMYLLDQDQRVLLKDTDLGHLLYFLTTNNLLSLNARTAKLKHSDLKK